MPLHTPERDTIVAAVTMTAAALLLDIVTLTDTRRIGPAYLEISSRHERSRELVRDLTLCRAPLESPR